MGQLLTKSTSKHNESSLLLFQAALSGDINQLKDIVGQQIASFDSSSSSSYTKDDDNTKSKVDPRLRKFINDKSHPQTNGNNALHAAIFSNHFEIVKFLIESCGAIVRSSSDGEEDSRNNMGCSPLWIAAGYGRLDLVRYLMEDVVEFLVKQRQHDESDEKDEIQKKCQEMRIQLVKECNTTGDTPFLAAASKGNFEVCQYLLNWADKLQHEQKEENDGECCYTGWDLLTQENQAGDSPLSVCVGGGFHNPDGSSLLKLLLDKEEVYYNTLEVKEQQQQSPRPFIQKNSKGLTPLLIACERNFASIVEELIKYQYSNAQKNGRTGIHDLLESHLDEKGRTPLAVASFCGCDDVVQLLLSFSLETKDTSSDYSDNCGDDDATKHHVYVGKEMLEVADMNQCTPLWLAARTGNDKMVKLLVEVGGANTLTKDQDGLTPLDVAKKYKKEKVVGYFSPNDGNEVEEIKE